jgi:hypothetical protein
MERKLLAVHNDCVARIGAAVKARDDVVTADECRRQRSAAGRRK